MNHNRVLNVQDYTDLSPDASFCNRKAWETEMSIRTLRDFGALRPDAQLLGVGAGRERLIYLLSTQVRWVFATDIYLLPGRWSAWHDAGFLIDPGTHAQAFASTTPYDVQRIIPLHMDGRALRFPDNTFDGIFSSGSIEHFGEDTEFPQWESVTRAAQEIGRVLKPGGIASISTEFKIYGPGWGFDNVRCFSPEDLQRYIVEPSGLQPLDDLEAFVSPETMALAVPMSAFHTGNAPAVETVVMHDGYAFTSVHLALRKAGEWTFRLRD